MNRPGTLVIHVERCVGCKRCKIECAVAHSASKELATAMDETPRPQSRVTVEPIDKYSAPLQCRHCEDAPCVAVCPSGALKKNAPGYPVLFKRELCIGCKQCVMACPFGVVTVDRGGKHVLKCDLCVDRLKVGQRPACAEACHTGALRYQDLDDMTKEKRAQTLREYLVTVEKSET